MLDLDRSSLPKLVARCAAVVCGLTGARRWRLEATLALHFPRCDLVHVFEFVQYDETSLPIRIVGDMAPSRAMGSFRPRAVPELEDQEVSDRAMCQIASRGNLSVRSSQAPQKTVQTKLSAAFVVRVGEHLVTIAHEGPTRLSFVGDRGQHSEQHKTPAVVGFSRRPRGKGFPWRDQGGDDRCPRFQLGSRALHRGRALRGWQSLAAPPLRRACHSWGLHQNFRVGRLAHNWRRPSCPVVEDRLRHDYFPKVFACRGEEPFGNIEGEGATGCASVQVEHPYDVREPWRGQRYEANFTRALSEWRVAIDEDSILRARWQPSPSRGPQRHSGARHQWLVSSVGCVGAPLIQPQ